MEPYEMISEEASDGSLRAQIDQHNDTINHSLGLKSHRHSLCSSDWSRSFRNGYLRVNTPP